MDYPVAIPGCEQHNIVLRPSVWVGAKLMMDGQPVPKAKRRSFVFTRPDGGQATVKFKPSWFDPVPKLEIDGTIVSVAPALTVLQRAWAAWSICLVLTGGALGALVGFLASHVNTCFFRSRGGGLSTYLLTLTISVVAVASVLVGVGLVGGAIRR